MGELPQSQGCFVCGSENPFGLRQRFFTDENHGVYTLFRVEKRHCGYAGVCHGGIIASLLDETMGWATAVVKKRYFITADMNVRFVRPLPEGLEVRVNGRYLRDRVTLWLTEGEIVGPDGTVYAKGTGRYAPAPDEANERFLREVRKGVTGLGPFGDPLPSER